MQVVKRAKLPEILNEVLEYASELPEQLLIMGFKYYHQNNVNYGIMRWKYDWIDYPKGPIPDHDEDYDIIDHILIADYVLQTIFNVRIYDEETDYTLAEYSIID